MIDRDVLIYNTPIYYYIKLNEIDIIISRILRFFIVHHQEGGASKSNYIDPNTRISLPGTLYDKITDPRNLYYHAGNIHRYPELTDIENFSINMMWISRELNPKNEFIGGLITREEKEFQNIYPEQIAKWMVLNPRTNINLWYDSTMCTQEQIKNTGMYIGVYLDKVKSIGISIGKFYMRNIQDLDTVRQYPIIAGVDWPIYSRVDLLKLITAYETQIANNRKNIKSAFVYTDYTINPHSIRRVYKYGIPSDGFVGLKGNSSSIGFENSYMIFGSYNIYMLSALNDCILSMLCKLYAESQSYITDERKTSFYTRDGFVSPRYKNNGSFDETFPFSLSGGIMFTAHIRKTIDPTRYKYFDCIEANRNPDNDDSWYVFYEFVNSGSKFRIDINDRLYSIHELNIESKDPKDYICVINDINVSATRHSGHGSSDINTKHPTNLTDIIKNPDDLYIVNQDKYNKYISSGTHILEY
jgi:hypothetical protein